MAGETWNELARHTAEAFDTTMLVGVRSDGTWFATGGGVEYDGGSPLDAVRAVAGALEERHVTSLREAQREEARLEARLRDYRKGKEQ